MNKYNIMSSLKDIHAWFDYDKLYDRIVENANDGQIFVEIGCWLGKSTIYFALKAKACNKNFKIYAVDTWKGLNDHPEQNIAITKYNGDVYNEFLNNIKQWHVDDIIVPLKIDSEMELGRIANLFEKHSIDFLFINRYDKFWLVSDALHTWHDKVKNGGQIGLRGICQYKGIANVTKKILGEVEILPPNSCLYVKNQDKFNEPKHDSNTVKLQIVNDDQFIKIEEKIIEFRTTKKPKSKRITLAPFQTEHYNDIDLFKTKIYCERNDTDIVAFGSINYFPIHTLYADDIFFTYDLNPLKDIYTEAISTLGVARCHKPSITYYEEPIKARIIGPANGSEFWGETSELQEIAAKTISDDEVVEYMLNKPLMIRRSSWDFFQSIKSELPKDIILCEIKQTCRNQIKTFQNNWPIFDMPLIGLDYNFQRGLVAKVQLHYLEFQILGSLFLNWQIIAIGGSSRLFSMLPTKNLLLTTHDLYPNMHYIQRQLSSKRQSGINCSCRYCTIPICNVSPISTSLVQYMEILRKNIIWPEVEII